MGNLAASILGSRNLIKLIQNNYYYSKNGMITSIFLGLASYYYLGFQLCKINISYGNSTIGWFFILFYFLTSCLLINIILIELGLMKKSDNSHSKYLRYTTSRLRLSEINSLNNTELTTKQLINKNTNEFVVLQKQISNITTSVKSIEEDLIIVKKEAKTSNKRIDINKIKIEDHLLKKEKLKISDDFTQSKIEIILNTFKNLFPNIKINHFSDFAFTEKTETIKNKLKQPELRKFIEFLKVLQLNQVIGKNKTLLSKVIKNYFMLTEEYDTINRWINLKEYSFISEKTVKQIESYIREKK